MQVQSQKPLGQKPGAAKSTRTSSQRGKSAPRGGSAASSSQTRGLMSNVVAPMLERDFSGQQQSKGGTPQAGNAQETDSADAESASTQGRAIQNKLSRAAQGTGASIQSEANANSANPVGQAPSAAVGSANTSATAGAATAPTLAADASGGQQSAPTGQYGARSYPTRPKPNPYCPPPPPPPCDMTPEFSRINGGGNNRENPTLGTSGDNFLRQFPRDPSRDPSVTTLPSGREISNAVSNQNGQNLPNAQGKSDFLWLFGQFVDHDFAATPTDANRTAPIGVPGDDPVFSRAGIEELGFTRSALKNGEQFTENSHFLDLGQVYGQDREQANGLRSFEGGKMRIGEDGLLPRDENGQMIAGDGRAVENVALGSMHVTWLREHNRLADQIGQQNPSWSDERIFQEARRQNIGQYQSVVYNEFLPNLLGEGALSEYQGYNKDTDPRISNAFATAAYRFGHTMVSENILRLDANGNEHASGNLALRDAFFNQDALAESGVDPILRGLAAQQAQSVDPLLVESLRSFLFQAPGPDGALVGSDLAALNIQRGRDHQLPSYNDTREQMGLSRITSFDDPAFQNGVGQRLAQIYDSPDDIDLWVGGLAENAAGGSMLGTSFTNIVADQFTRLRDGDRFFYKNQFSGDELASLENTSLADIIERNSGVSFGRENIFQAAAPSGNQAQSTSADFAPALSAPQIQTQPNLNDLRVITAEMLALLEGA